MHLYKIRRREFLHLSAAAAAMTCAGNSDTPTTSDTSSTGDGSTTAGTTGTPPTTTTAATGSSGDGTGTTGTTGTTTTTTTDDPSSTSTTGEPASTTSETGSTTTGESGSTTGEPGTTTTGESTGTGVVCTPMGVDTGLIAADFMVDACMKTVKVMNIYVLRDADGFYAITDVCTHAGCTVPCPVGGVIQCPCHGSQYNANGDVVQGPAPKDLVHYLLSFECIGDVAKIYVDKSQVLADRTTRVLPP